MAKSDVRMLRYKDPWSVTHQVIFSECGDPEVMEYSPYYDDNGVLQLRENGKKNLYQEIQSHKLSCDIHYILKRFANGEMDVLSKVQGAFGDFTNLPKNFAEVMNLTIDAQNHFDSLPVEVKQKFDNNFVQYMQSFGSDDWAMKVGLVKDQPAVSSESEVKFDES